MLQTWLVEVWVEWGDVAIHGSSANLLDEIQGLLMKAFVPPDLQSGGF